MSRGCSSDKRNTHCWDNSVQNLIVLNFLTIFSTQSPNQLTSGDDSSAGDVGAKFCWDITLLKLHFGLSPAMCYIRKNGYALSQVQIRPSAVKDDIRVNRVACFFWATRPTR